MLALAHGAHRRVLDVGRGVEVRLADAKGNEILPLAGELVDFGEDHEGVLGAEILCASADLGHFGYVRGP